MSDSKSENKVLLITGAGKRVGATIARYCHLLGMRIAIHYRTSRSQATQLCCHLNQQRPDSALSVGADLCKTTSLQHLIDTVINQWGRLDVLINNASSFYPTPFASATLDIWDDMMASNLKAPFFYPSSQRLISKNKKGVLLIWLTFKHNAP